MSDTVPAAGSKMVYNLSNLEYAPVNDSSTSYVPMVYSERDPLETDNASVGTMWVNEGIPNEVTAWMATYTNGTNTFWRELAVHPSVPLFAASPTAPTSPQQGTIWVDSNFNPPRAKYWLGTAWRNIA